MQVKELWEVLGLDLIGPLPETARNNKYVLTMTDLYTKWVFAEPMQSKTAAEVLLIITAKLYLFGMVRKIITDQGKEFVCKDERTNENIKRTLRKYVNDNHNDWDLHLPAVVYGINTAKQYSTRHSPYFLLFHRHPRLPEVMNACPMGDDFEVADPEDDIDTRVNKMKLLNETVLHIIERAQSMQQKSFQNCKRKFVRVCSVQAGDDVLLSRDPKKRRTGDTFTSQHQGPYTVSSISSKGVATILKGSACQCVKTEDILQIKK
uniref:Integrase catalytic domain-containing protein n=1 Tax=Cyprinus carpio TaxID=7962 RepID=A0A8C2F3R1_CYPCA